MKEQNGECVRVHPPSAQAGLALAASLVLTQFLRSMAPNLLHTTVFLKVAYYSVPTGPLSQVCWLSLYTEAVEMSGAECLELAWITSGVILLP